jgi:hypothetical protein
VTAPTFFLDAWWRPKSDAAERADRYRTLPGVKAATDYYRAEQDTVGRFIGEVLVLGRGFARSSEIKAELESWCEELGLVPPTLREIAAELQKAGCRSERRKSGGQKFTIWTGVSIAEAPMEMGPDQHV